jgi:hypothetical protein
MANWKQLKAFQKALQYRSCQKELRNLLRARSRAIGTSWKIDGIGVNYWYREHLPPNFSGVSTIPVIVVGPK